MLIFERFRASNAYPFKEIDLNLRNQGLVRMVGPNGAGKSSVWHLFTQCAQGSTPNGQKKSDIMIGDKDFLLEITFQKNGATYVAAQAAKCKLPNPLGEPYATGIYLYRDGQDISMHKDPDTLKLIKSTFGWSLEEWYGYVYLAQATIHTLIKGTRSERQAYLSGLFNLQPLDILAKYFKEKADDLALKVEEVERFKQELAIKSQMYVEALHKKAAEDYENALAEVEILEGKIKKEIARQRDFEMRQSLEKKLSALTRPEITLENLKRHLSDHENAQANVISNRLLLAQYEKNLKELEVVTEPSMPEGWSDEYTDSPDLDEKREQGELSRLMQLEASLKPVPIVQIPQDLSAVLSSPDINVSAVKRQIVEIESRPAPPLFAKPTPEQVTAVRDARSEISYKILNVETEVQRLQFNEQVCDQCGTTLNCSDREATLKLKADELAELKDEFIVCNTKLTRWENQLGAWSEYEALGPDRSGELPELKASVELFAKKQQYLVIRDSQAAYELYDKSRTEVTALPELRERLRIYRMRKAAEAALAGRVRFEAYCRERDKLQKQIGEVETLPDRAEAIAVVQAQIATHAHLDMIAKELEPYKDAPDLTEKIEKLVSEKGSVQTGLGRLKSEVDASIKIQEQVAILQAAIAKQEHVIRDQKRYALLAKGYGKAGQLRELQLAKFSRYLEDALLAHTIKQLPDHRFNIRVDDGIDILAEYIGTEKPPADPYDVKFMSGGECGALSVAFLFALDDLLPPSRRTNLKIIDEVEAGFDPERQKDFITFTLPELKSRAETVVVISHSHAANAGSFDRLWEIKNGVVKNTTQDYREFEAHEPVQGSDTPKAKPVSKRQPPVGTKPDLALQGART